MEADEDRLVDEPTLLKALLRVRHWQTRETFSRQWDKVAKTLDSSLVGTCPAHAEFYRWLRGNIRGMPHPDACRVLEAMFPGVTVQQFFQPVRARRSELLGPPRAPLPTVDNDSASPAFLLAFPVTAYADTAYLDAAQQYIWHIIALDGCLGGADLAPLVVRFFRSVHQQLDTGAYEPAIERDLHATAGELAEVAGWLLYDANRQDDVRSMNQESLYFCRLAGDRSMELLTLQNASMHASFLGLPREALHLARSVLESRDRLTPRVRTLFVVREARALAQGGDERALRLFDQARSHYEDGVRGSDPKWAWWVDERELAWHEGMALADLGRPREALSMFERSVAATAPQYRRNRYMGLGYLLGAQVKVGAWRDAEATMRQIAAMVGHVNSARMVVLLAGILPELKHEHIPGNTRETAEQLSLLMSQKTP
ncbi:MAG: XRE family transcriptional regulator [Pseudonocardiaceae bacterium]